MRIFKVFLALLLLLGAVAITWGGLRERPPAPVEVQIAAARRDRIVRTVTGAGKIQAATTVKISSNLSGDLVELLVKEADPVVRGQVLGRIDPRRFEAALKQTVAAFSAARAEVRLARVEAEQALREQQRVQGLVEQGMASPAELEQLQAARDSAVARHEAALQRQAQAAAAVEEAQNSLSQTTLVAPIDGTVIQVAREVGERVRGSDFSEDVVLVLAILSAMEVRLEVGEHEVIHLRLGQEAEIGVDALEEQTFPGRVLEIAQQGVVKNEGTEAEVTTFPVTVALDRRPPGVLPGMSSEVRIVAEVREGATIVPIQAVTVRSAKLVAKLAQREGRKEQDPAGAAGAADVDSPKVSEDAGVSESKDLGVSGDGGTLDSVDPGAVAGKTAAVARAASSPSRGLVKVVFLVDEEDKARLRQVTTGISTDTEIEILEGLVPGDRVVEGPYRTLTKDLEDGRRLLPASPEGQRAGKGPGGGA